MSDQKNGPTESARGVVRRTVLATRSGVLTAAVAGVPPDSTHAAAAEKHHAIWKQCADACVQVIEPCRVDA